MKKAITTGLACALASQATCVAAAGDTSYSLGVHIPARCSIQSAYSQPVSPGLQLVTISADCNLEQFSIRLAGLHGDDGIVKAKASVGHARVGASDQVHVRASRPGRQVVQVWVPADTASEIIPQLVA